MICEDIKKDYDSIKNWHDFIIATGSNIDTQTIRTPIKPNQYNQTQLAFSNDGYVWGTNSRGMVRIFKNCPIHLMAEMYFHKIWEFEKE